MLRFDSTAPVRKPILKVGKATKVWDGFCPACSRGADGFGGWIWCDCGAKADDDGRLIRPATKKARIRGAKRLGRRP